GSGIRIPDRETFLVPGGLREDTSQFDFARVGRLASHLTLPSHRLFRHHRHSCSIHLHIQDRNRLADDDRQVQLHGSPDLFLLVRGDVRPDGFRRSLHGFGGYLQVGEEFQFLPAMSERCVLSHQSLHPAHSWRQFHVFDIQFDISGELAVVTLRAQVVRTRDLRLADGGEDGFRAQSPVTGQFAATPRDGKLLGSCFGKMKQFGQRRCTRLVHGRAHGHLEGFQIQSACLSAAVEDDAQELVYFARDFLEDRGGCFFSTDESPSGCAGRIWQIWALISISSLCRPCNLRNSAISRSAFRVAEWSGKDWVTDFPLTLYVRRRLGPWPGSLG